MNPEMYVKMSDEEIIKNFKNDNDAIEYLIKKYRGLVKKEVRPFFLIGADTEDLIQEGLIGLFGAINSYDENKETTFSTFARTCVRNKINTAVKESNYKKHIPLNSYISFFEKRPNSETELVDELEAGVQSSPENVILGEIISEDIWAEINQKLSKYEKKVLNLYLDGYSREEMSDELEKPMKSIDNTIQRIRKKILDILESLGIVTFSTKEDKGKKKDNKKDNKKDKKGNKKKDKKEEN